jgi:hypothetical protein
MQGVCNGERSGIQSLDLQDAREEPLQSGKLQNPEARGSEANAQKAA